MKLKAGGKGGTDSAKTWWWCCVVEWVISSPRFDRMLIVREMKQVRSIRLLIGGSIEGKEGKFVCVWSEGGLVYSTVAGE